MAELFLLTKAQMRRIEPYFPLSHGKPRVDDRRVISGIVFVIRNGLRWRDAPAAYGPHKTLYNRFVRWSRMGVFSRILAEAGGLGRSTRTDHDRQHSHQGPPNRLKPAKKRAASRCIGRTKGGLNSKLHAVCDGIGRPVALLLTEGQVSDHKGAAFLIDALPPAARLIADRGYDSDSYRRALRDRGIEPCIPSRSKPQGAHLLRPDPLSPAPQGREHVC